MPVDHPLTQLDIRGVFPAAYLAELESRFFSGSPITSHFDMVAGTSTGGIIALAFGPFSVEY